MKKIIWEVQYLSPPTIIKHCKRCGKKTEYASSGQFRVNAQKKHLDIWLIYKCIHCSTTWNAAIYSRIDSKSLNPDLLDLFYANDEALADQYAMDTKFLRQNGVEIGSYYYNVTGGCFSSNDPVELHIISRSTSNIKVSSVIREKLGLSVKIFKDLLSQGHIKDRSGQDLEKCRLDKETVVIFNGEKQELEL